MALAQQFNGDLNEDEALRNAIAASLEEQRRPTFIKTGQSDAIIAKSRKVVDLTDKTEEKMCRLLKMKFQTRITNGKIPRLPKVKEPERDDLTATQRLRLQQDKEYQEALAMAQEAELAESSPPPEDPEPAEDEIEEPEEEYSGMLAARVSALAPEPETGITIALQPQNSSRVSRRFAEDAQADDVYVWAASIEAIRSDGVRLGSFDLRGPDGILNPTQTLGTQIQGRRVLLNINPRE